MRLWLLKRKGEADYDETQGLVVRAETPNRARQLAHTRTEEDAFLRPKITSCRELHPYGPEDVILVDYNRG